MKSWQLDKRIGNLSQKLKPVESDVVRLDFASFTEPEKQLFRKIWEIHEEYGDSPPNNIIEANKEFVFKALDVLSWRVSELFMFVMCEILAEDEIEEWYFKLHFYNFFVDLKECLQRVRRWSDRDREEFLRDMKQTGMLNGFFRFRRGPEEDSGKKRRSRRGQL